MYIKNSILILLSSLFLVHCITQDSAQLIVDKAIAYAGGAGYEKNIIEFDFRKYHLRIDEKNGIFRYTRSYIDSLGKHIQIYDNQGLTYKINNDITEPSEKQKQNIIEAINSQVYFARLPYKLNDSAVIKEYKGKEIIKDRPYHKIKITFRPEGGGIDFEDEFLYWFDVEDYSLDYLAYLFHVNEGGLRFREAFDHKKVHNIAFQHYYNYKPKANTTLDSLSILFNENKLIKLSEIMLENVQVFPR